MQWIYAITLNPTGFHNIGSRRLMCRVAGRFDLKFHDFSTTFPVVIEIGFIFT